MGSRTDWSPEPDTWRAVAKEYRDKRVIQGMADLTRKKMEILIEKTLPGIGNIPVRDLRPVDLLSILRIEESKGHFETATRLRALMGQIFRYAVATGRAESDPSRDLKDAILPPRPKHLAGLTERNDIGALMRAVREYDGDPAIKVGLLTLAYTFVRPGELRLARWDELSGTTWTIPAERMKANRKHVVPLSNQCVELMNWLQPYSQPSEYIFPQKHNIKRPISDGTLNAALRRLGYSSSEHVPHGFRTTASTNLNENNWNSDWIEAQLAHVPRNTVRAAYNAAQYLKDRRRMMQWWADWLDAAERDV